MRNDILAPGFKTTPYWWEAAEPVERPADLPAETQVAVVGGGYAGLNAALTLARLGHEVTVLDAERIGWGASSRSGGMVSGGMKLSLAEARAAFGERKAEEIAAACNASFPFIEELLTREGIDADYVRCGRFTAAWTPKHYQGQEAGAATLARITGMPTRMVPRAQQREALGSDYYHGGMIAEASGSMHPAKYARGLAAAAERAGARLVDRVRVNGWKPEGSGWRLTTSRGEMRAAKILTATNGYSLSPEGKTPNPWFARRMVPLASFLIATEELDPELIERLFPRKRMIGDTRRVLSYFRPSPDGRRVLYGGRVSFSPMKPEEAAPGLYRMMTNVFPELAGVKITHAWTGNVSFTFDGLRHIGEHEGVFYAGGCQGNGVAMASWIGHQVGLKIAGAANAPFALDDIDFPTRPLYRGNPNLVLPFIGNWYRMLDAVERIAA
ncbi:FAD-binding oxidoreductase [Rhodovarius crocodyli]|uniref:FAD-binding oxidoreductase n=1 Tax=Rhodovarius crocodyli TaxID=1979269 RepID=A0A437ME41_9PROT|nr:FAD-binding oxidoreductase [Rhodovarius crocodyli]RVT95896.1 FAD-binding oxidoreductase [Rhodovarius crocodyli]